VCGAGSKCVVLELLSVGVTEEGERRGKLDGFSPPTVVTHAIDVVRGLTVRAACAATSLFCSLSLSVHLVRGTAQHWCLGESRTNGCLPPQTKSLSVFISVSSLPFLLSVVPSNHSILFLASLVGTWIAHMRFAA
jgi:hypothetical protein